MSGAFSWLPGAEDQGEARDTFDQNEAMLKEAAQKQREFARLFFDVFMTGRGPELLQVMRDSTIELDLMAVSPVIMNGMREMGVGPAEWAYHRNGQNSVVRWIETMIRLSQAVETEETNDV